jgi:DNA-binding NtrC family response regulator
MSGPDPAKTVSLPGKKHVLLVDDDPSLGEALGACLRRAGFDVSLATDFRVALDVLDAGRRVDLLLTDLVMPASVNGIALSRMARMRHSGIKVLYMTGYDIPGAEQQALGPILKKPVDDSLLVSEVERALATA